MCHHRTGWTPHWLPSVERCTHQAPPELGSQYPVICVTDWRYSVMLYNREINCLPTIGVLAVGLMKHVGVLITKDRFLKQTSIAKMDINMYNTDDVVFNRDFWLQRRLCCFQQRLRYFQHWCSSIIVAQASGMMLSKQKGGMEKLKAVKRRRAEER